MKKCVFLLFLLLLFTVGCGKEEAPPVFLEMPLKSYTVYDNADLSFDEFVQHATDVMVAECKGSEDTDRYVITEFSVITQIKGATESSVIHVYDTPSVFQKVTDTGTEDAFGVYNFVPGCRYVLVLERQTSVYYEHDRYFMMGDIFLPLDNDIGFYMDKLPMDKTSSVTNEALTTANIQTVVTELCKQVPDGWLPYSGKLPLTADSVGELAEAAPYILRLRVGEQIYEGVYNNTQTFLCHVEEILKGPLTAEEMEDWNDQILMIFRKGEAEIGEEYLVLADRSDVGSRQFKYVSMQDSVHPIASDGERLALYETLGYHNSAVAGS